MKITHTIEWEPRQGKYRILRLTGDKRQPTLNEAMEYMRRNHLPEEIWVVGFLNNPDRYDDYLDDGDENKTLELREYTGHHGSADDGICPICGMAIDLYHDKDKCPLCGKEWGVNVLNQISFFDGTQPFRNDKPIRLIELFAGYGSQALALKYLGVPFEHYRISEWATKSIQAYKDIHAAADKTDYSKGLTVDEIKAWLANKISLDYNTPASEAQINRMGKKTARQLYNAMRATRNVGSITQATASDLAIEQPTNSFTY